MSKERCQIYIYCAALMDKFMLNCHKLTTVIVVSRYTHVIDNFGMLDYSISKRFLFEEINKHLYNFKSKHEFNNEFKFDKGEKLG